MDLSDLASVFALQTLSTDRRAIRLRMAHKQELLNRILLPQRVAVTEAVCDGLTVDVTCLSTRDDLPLDSFSGLPIDVQLVTDRGELRSFCAIVMDAQQGQSDGSLTAIHLTARDAWAVLEQRVNFRVFLNKSVLDIARLLLDEWRQRSPVLARAFDYRLLHVDESRYPKRAFCLQANESDAHFLRRLLRRNGIAWCFRACPADDETDTPRHELVLFDDGLQLPQNASGEVRYHRRDGTEKADTVHLLAPAARLIRGAVVRRSYDHEAASVHEAVETSALSQGELGTELAAALVDARIEMPHAGDSHADHQRLTRLAMQHHEFAARCLHGAGSVRTFAAGEWSRIAGHAGLDAGAEHEREFVVVRVEHWCENNLPKALNERAQALLDGLPATAQQDRRGDGEHRYGNTFIAVRRDVPIVPAWEPHTDLPRLPTLTAVVVGPQDEAVWCDELGRVKVRFLGLDPADHAHAQGAGTSDTDADSAWIRVDFGWAGDGFGVLFPLRAGMEVDVRLDDPDRPMITGSRYNAHNRPPRFGAAGEVNDNRYLLGIRTQEVRGNRHNQLRFDDTPGQISVQLASEHAHSEISLGYLTAPREHGAGEPCGEGIMARTGAAAAIRAAQGLLLCAEARPGGTGRQLAREELLACLEAARELTQTLAEAAQQALGERLDAEPQRRLQAALEDWEGGSNTQPQGAGGQQPVVAVSAAAGLALTTPRSTTLYAGENLDIASQRDTQQSAGKRWLVNVGATISWFAAGIADLAQQTAAAVAVKLIAARGNILLQAQSGAVELQARRDISLGAHGRVSIDAQGGITLTEQGGAQIELAGGNVTVKCPGQYTVQAAGFSFSGPGGSVPRLPALPGQAALHDWLGLAYLEPDTGSPVDAAPYEVGYDNGVTMEGTLTDNGTARHDSVPERPVREVVYRPREPAPDPVEPATEALQ